jgi:hypothetical protein
VSAGKFLGFIIHELDIEIDPAKLKSVWVKNAAATM